MAIKNYIYIFTLIFVSDDLKVQELGLIKVMNRNTCPSQQWLASRCEYV